MPTSGSYAGESNRNIKFRCFLSLGLIFRDPQVDANANTFTITHDASLSEFCPIGFSKSVHPLVRISWTTRVKNLPHETKTPTMKCAHQQHKPASPAHTITRRPCHVHVANRPNGGRRTGRKRPCHNLRTPDHQG